MIYAQKTSTKPRSQNDIRNYYLKSKMCPIVVVRNKYKPQKKEKSIESLLRFYVEEKPIYQRLIIVLREAVNKKYKEIFKKEIKRGAFSKNSDFFDDIKILSDKNTPFNVQKELLSGILSDHIYSIKKEEIEQICDTLNSCGPVIRSRVFFYFFYSIFNKKLIKGPNLNLKMKIYFFKKERIINRLKKFNCAYNANDAACSDILNRIFRIAYLFEPTKFEDIFNMCLDMIIKYNQKSIKTNHIRKGKWVMKKICAIMEKHKGNEELLKKLINLAIRRKNKPTIQKIFKELHQKSYSLTSRELILEIDKIIKKGDRNA